MTNSVEADINKIFNLLDDWRHLPDYQLERRADVFFSIYLPRFLSDRLNLDISPLLIPEFPIRIGTIDPTTESNQSCKVDYLALDDSGAHAIFVELKTDSASRRDKQNKYLEDATKLRLPALIKGVVQIVCASEHKHKYCHLLRLLEKHSLIKLPANLNAALESRQFSSAVNACLSGVAYGSKDPSVEVLYLQPTKSKPDEIGFDEFATWLESRDEVLAARLAASLRNWATILPGRSSSIEAEKQGQPG